jgi:hypothetical protein
MQFVNLFNSDYRPENEHKTYTVSDLNIFNLNTP